MSVFKDINIEMNDCPDCEECNCRREEVYTNLQELADDEARHAKKFKPLCKKVLLVYYDEEQKRYGTREEIITEDINFVMLPECD